MVTSPVGSAGRLVRLLMTVFAALAVVLVGWDSGPVEALELDSSSPEDGASLADPPTSIILTFDEEIGTSNLVAAGCNGDPFVLPQPVLSSDALTLTIEMDAARPMPQGTCVIEYTVSNPDGDDEVNGRFAFAIQNSPVTTPGITNPPDTTTAVTTPPAAETDADPSSASTVVAAERVPSSGGMWLGRLLSTLGLAVLFGAFVLILFAWPEGPEYVVAVNFLRAAWVVAMIGTLLYVIGFAAAANGESLGDGVSPNAWLDLMDAGWPGRAALARLALCALCGWVVVRPERVIDPTTQLPAIALPTLAMATVGLSRTGGDLAIVGVLAGIGHALAMGMWFGAVVLLARVVLAGPGDEDLVGAVRGFHRLSGPAIVVTLITGFIQMYRLVGGALLSTGHGRLLLGKVVVVALMVFIGLSARQVAQHRMARAADLSQSAADQLRRAFGSEAVIGIVVLALSAGLLSFTPDKAPPAEAAAAFAVEKAVVDAGSGLDLVVRLDEGRVGPNRLQVEVRGPESGLSGLVLTFEAPIGSGVSTIVQPIPLTGAGTADTFQASVPFNVAGAWSLQIEATTSTGAVSGAGGSFDIRNADGSLPSSDIDPTPTGPPVTAATTSSVAPTTTP